MTGAAQHRDEGDVRPVPCPPQQTALFCQHLAAFGAAPDGRLFQGVHGDGGQLPTITYRRAWDKARKSALTKAQYASPLGKRPYDLWHARVSTWLNGGVAPTQAAEWAGHSVEVLLRIYAKCLDGQHEIAKRRIMRALTGDDGS